MRVLLIEDHPRLARSIVDGLTGFGFGVLRKMMDELLAKVREKLKS